MIQVERPMNCSIENIKKTASEIKILNNTCGKIQNRTGYKYKNHKNNAELENLDEDVEDVETGKYIPTPINKAVTTKVGASGEGQLGIDVLRSHLGSL